MYKISIARSYNNVAAGCKECSEYFKFSVFALKNFLFYIQLNVLQTSMDITSSILQAEG